MLLHALMKTAKTYPEKIALILGDERLRYATLLERIISFMDRLRLLQVREGQRIVLLLPNSIAFVVSFYALAGLKAIALPVNPILKLDELKYYLTDNDISVIVTDTEHAGLCREAAGAIGRDIAVVITDNDAPTTYAHQSSHLLELVPFEGPVNCLYSSGSTGQAKKVCRTQKNMSYEVEIFVNGTHMTAADTVLCVVPLFHALGFGKCMLAPIATGATVVILEQVVRDGVTVELPFVFRSQRVFELIAQEHITMLPASPYIFGVLAETPADTLVNVSSLRLCMTAGNILPEETFTRFKQRFGIPLRSIYGSTETGSVSLNMEPDDDVRYDSVGRPGTIVEVRITDETLHEFPVGSIGEVAVKSPSMAMSYLDMPELNGEKFKDGFFFMGDLGKKDEQGRLYITGRKKIFIDSGGEKVDPQEIERVLLSHPAVNEAAVVGIAGPYGGEAIKAVLVLQEELTELEILLYCKNRLSSYKVPRIVEFRQALPRNLLGKIVRSDLIAGQSLLDATISSQREGTLRARVIEALITSEESAAHLLTLRLCEQIAALLHRDITEIDGRQPLGELGLGSLMAVELRDWLEVNLELTIPVTLFWSYPTASALATHVVSLLHRSVSAGPSTPVPLPQETVETQHALHEIEHLSDAEVQQELERITTEILENT